jgi:hypothetical protein
MSDRPIVPSGQQRREEWIARSNATRRWTYIGQGAPYADLSCQEFKAQKVAIWISIKQRATQNASGKKQAVKTAVATMIADIESWGANGDRRYILYAYDGSYGVAVVNSVGFEVQGHATLNYCLSDMSKNNIGVCLIEEAVTWSERRGKNGKLCLIAMSDFLETHYAKLGFITIQPANSFSGALMTLDPRRQGDIRWYWRNGRWNFLPFNT